MNFQNIKIFEIDFVAFKISEIEVRELAFNRKKYLEKTDVFVIYETPAIYFQLTEDAAKNTLRKYIEESIRVKENEITARKNRLETI